MKDKLIGNEKNILFYNDDELNENSTCAKIAQVQNEGTRKVRNYVSDFDRLINETKQINCI